MLDLRQQLETLLHGRVAIVGVGNIDYGDDGFGVRLAEQLVSSGLADVIVAGNTPERFIGRIADEGFDTVLFIDAVEFGAEAGSAVLLDSDEMAAKFPQLSTHKISLGLFSKWVESNGTTKAWLLGVQPESLKASVGLTNTVQTTLDVLAEILFELSSKQGIATTRTQRTEEVHA